jgi:hypothetical protein
MQADRRPMRPDYYLVLPWHFRKEFLERGRETIRAGTKLMFPLPAVEIASDENYETAVRASASAQSGVQGLLFGEVLPTR